MPETPSAAPTFVPTQLIPVEHIKPSPYQARKDFDEESLKSLARSIETEGLLEPVVVRRIDPFANPTPLYGHPISQGDGQFELIAGERRWRAYKLMGWPQIEAKVVTTVSEAAAMAKGLAENLQRRELNPIEEAQGYEQLNQLDRGYWTQDKIAEEFGVSQTDVSNSISLLELPPDVQGLITRVILSKRHGILLARLKDKTLQSRLAEQAAKEEWSVKELESQISEIRGKTKKASPQKDEEDKDPLADIWDALGWNVGYKGGRRWGFDVDLEQEPALDGKDHQAAVAELLTKMGKAIAKAEVQPGPGAAPKPAAEAKT